MANIFKLRDILTVTTGRLLTKPVSDNDNGIGNLYEILEYLTGEAPFTHSLGRFCDECKPYLLNWYPELQNADVSVLDKTKGDVDWIDKWLDRCVEEWGMSEFYTLGKIPTEAHSSKNPVIEPSEMCG